MKPKYDCIKLGPGTSVKEAVDTYEKVNKCIVKVVSRTCGSDMTLGVEVYYLNKEN